MKKIVTKLTTRILCGSMVAAFGVVGLVLASTSAMAESTYGYNSTGAGTVIATARVNVILNVPRLILLRVGADNTAVDTLTFNGAFSAIPGGITGAALTAAGTGNSLPSPWNGTAPAFGAPATQALTAFAWTNSSGGGQLALATAVNTALAGFSAASITVVPTAGVGTMPVHPGTTTNATIGTFTRNTVHSASWAYGVSAATLAAAAAGTYSQTTTYTATSL